MKYMIEIRKREENKKEEKKKEIEKDSGINKRKKRRIGI